MCCFYSLHFRRRSGKVVTKIPNSLAVSGQTKQFLFIWAIDFHTWPISVSNQDDCGRAGCCWDDATGKCFVPFSVGSYTYTATSSDTSSSSTGSLSLAESSNLFESPDYPSLTLQIIQETAERTHVTISPTETDRFDHSYLYLYHNMLVIFLILSPTNVTGGKFQRVCFLVLGACMNHLAVPRPFTRKLS